MNESTMNKIVSPTGFYVLLIVGGFGETGSIIGNSFAPII